MVNAKRARAIRRAQQLQKSKQQKAQARVDANTLPVDLLKHFMETISRAVTEGIERGVLAAIRAQQSIESLPPVVHGKK